MGHAPVMSMTFVPTARNGALLEALQTAGLSDAGHPLAGPTTLRLTTLLPVPLSDVVSTTEMHPEARSRIVSMLREGARQRSVSTTSGVT